MIFIMVKRNKKKCRNEIIYQSMIKCCISTFLYCYVWTILNFWVIPDKHPSIVYLL